MKTLIFFGNREIEVSSTYDDRVSQELSPTLLREELHGDSRTQNRPREETRLFDSHPWIIEEDDDEQVLFDHNSDATRPLFQEAHHSLLTSMDTSPISFQPPVTFRMPSKDVLALLDQLERSMDDVHHASTSTSSSWSLKNLLTRFRRPQSISSKGAGAPVQNEGFDKSCPKTKSGVTWKRLSPASRIRPKSKKQASDTALLIPHNTQESEWSQPHEDAAGLKAVKNTTKIHGSKQLPHPTRKPTRFLHRILLGGCLPLKSTEDATMDTFDLPPYDAHSASANDDDNLGDNVLDVGEDTPLAQRPEITFVVPPDETHVAEQPKKTFRNDEELVDHLVKVCDTSSSLEEGFNCLQERIRTRSLSKAQTSTSSAENTVTSSPSLLDLSNQETWTLQKPQPRVAATPITIAASPFIKDPQNNTIASLSSLEDFLMSVNDSNHSASLEALMFEQELDKLSREELSLLLDEELEKLMHEGLA